MFSKPIASIGIASLALGTFGSALHAVEPTDPSPTEATAERRSPLETTSSEAANNADELPSAIADVLACPPGQFPSAFRDVYPFHWAYTAVNSLASESQQCFDFPENYR